MRQPKYALAAYDVEAEDDEIWALCTDAENLFGDPHPPARGTYELLGCAPEGELTTALARARADGSAPLGFLALQILDKKGDRVDEWCLEDVRVLSDRPSARDLSLLDVTIEARQSPHNSFDYPQCPPLSPGYRLLGTEDEARGSCRDLAYVENSRPDLVEPSVRLLGSAPQGALRTALNAGEEDLGHAKLMRLDASGRAIQCAVEGELVAWIPSGRGLVDLTLEPWSERPPTAAREVWELWDDGRPAQSNAWARCGTEGRRYWLDTVRDNHVAHTPDASPGGTYHLDGRHITDEPGFFCALGEAVNGPGGYFGWGLDALADCLCGGWGAGRSFNLVWHDAEVARTCLGLTPRIDNRPWTFEELLEFLAAKGIQVRLA